MTPATGMGKIVVHYILDLRFHRCLTETPLPHYGEVLEERGDKGMGGQLLLNSPPNGSSLALLGYLLDESYSLVIHYFLLDVH